MSESSLVYCARARGWVDQLQFRLPLKAALLLAERGERRKEKVKEGKDPNGTEPSMSILLYLNHLKPRCARGFPVKTSNILLQKMCIEIGICMQFKCDTKQGVSSTLLLVMLWMNQSVTNPTSVKFRQCSRQKRYHVR